MPQPLTGRLWQNTPMLSPTSIAILLASLAALAPFAIDTYLPAFPALETDLNATTLQIQQSLTFYLLPYALMTLWHGAISDAIGRLTTIKWGLGIFALASIGCALAPNIETLWFFRFAQGLSAGAGNVVARAMVRDLFSGVAAHRVMAQVQMIFGIAPAVAPIIGGLLLGIHWQAIFVFLALYAVAATVIATIHLPETMPVEKRTSLNPSQLFRQFRQVFSDGEFNRLIVSFGANFAGFFVYVLAAPVFLIHHLGLGSHQFGMLFIPTVCGMVFGSWLSRRVAGRLPGFRILRIAYAWMGLSVVANIIVCLLSPESLAAYIAPIASYNIGMALAMPVLSVAALDRHPKIRGTAASGQAFVQMLLSTVSAGAVLPLIWSRPLGLALGMGGYLLLGLFAAMQSHVWKRG